MQTKPTTGITQGQRLYELKHPKFIRVWTASIGGESMLVPNPAHQVDWKFITAAAKQSYEVEARTHHLTCTGGN